MRSAFIWLLTAIVWGCTPVTAPDRKKETPMKLLWEIPYEFIGTAVTSTPMLLGDSLVIMTAGKDLLAVEQETGKIRWRTFVSNETNLQTDVFRTDGVRIFATHVEDVRAYYIVDGTLAWLTPLPGDGGQFWNDEIAYASGRVLVGGYHTAYCIDAASGSVMWARQLQTKGLVTDAATFEDKAYFGGAYGISNVETVTNVYCLNLFSGDSVWTYKLKGNGKTYLMSTVHDSVLYAGTTFEAPSSLEAIDAMKGEQKWAYRTNEFWDYNYAIIVGDRVIANAGPYHVAAFNKHTGQLLWRTFITWNANAGKLHYYNGYVYHPHGIRIYILDPETGQIVYTLNGANGARLYTMAVGNGKVFVQGWPSLQCYEAYKP